MTCLGALFGTPGAIQKCSLLLGDDLDLLSDGEAPLSLVDHSLEALEIAEVGTNVLLGELGGEGSLGPLVGETGSLDSLGESAGASTALNFNLHPGKRDSFQW